MADGRVVLRRTLFVLGCVWAAPISLAGLMLVALTRCDFVCQRDGALFFVASPWFNRVFFVRFRVAAFTWAQVICAAPDCIRNEGVIVHELVHFFQARIFGVLMPLAYGVGSLVALIQGKSAYADNFLESWARKASGR